MVAEVEGQAPVTETVWAVVEGFRERQSTFVTFSTDEMPLWILHDPPGSNSYAYVEEGFTSCRRLTDIEFTSSEIGAVTNFEVGFKSSTGVAAGAVMITEGGVGFYNRFDALETTGRTKLGTGPNREICITTKQRFQTSAEPYSVSDHLYVGAGLNLIFAEADRLTATGSCTITKDLTLAADLNLENAFSTTYLYSENHIEHTLLPELEDLAGLIGNGGNGNATSNDTGILLGASGPVTQIMVEKAQANWQAHLDLGVTNTEEGVLVGATNYSFSGGGSAFESAIGVDTTATTDLVYTVDVNDYTEEFGVLATKFGYDNRVGARFSFTTESVTEKEETETSSQTIGYVLSDPDVGDFFSVDVGTDPVYGTPVFQTVSGRSSVPHEEGTQQRDNPEIEINPPVIYDADPDEAANFQVTVINNSESAERRVYTLAVPGETNTRNLSITTTGDLLGGERLESFTLEPGEARTINLDVFASPSAYSYEDVGLVLYSAEEFELWLKDPRREFGASDMAFFSVYFTAPCSEMTLSGLNQGWTYSNGATPLSFAVGNYNLDPDLVLNGDLANMTIGAEYKRSGTGDWIPITSETGDVLEANGMSSIVVNWTPPQDGTYEVRGFSSCQTSTGLELIDGASIYGTVDTGIPTAFGTPEPADGSLGLGDIASVTFQEDLNCATINDATGTANVQIGVLDDSGTVTSTLTDVTATCNDRTLTIAPTGGWNDTHDGNRYEVRILSDQPTVPADELGNEIQSDIVWQFVVQRSGFAWNPVNLVVATTVGTERTLTADLVNGRAEDLDFTVNGPLSLALLDGSGNPTATTVDLEADYTSGTIPSGGQWPVSFTVPGTLSEGIWSGQVDAEGTVYGQSIGSVPLFARVQVGCAPVWNANDVDGSDFAYSMSVTGRLAIDGIVSDDTADFVAAFVGNELRGLANVTDGNGTVYLTVYSNSLQGELVTFQAYDASACTSYPGAEQTVLFASGDVVGSPAQPQAINATLTAPQQQIALNSGWTWFSLNREPASTAIADVLASISATPGDVVKNHSAFAIYDADNGWVGGLTNIDVGQAYQIQLASANTLTITGNAVDLNATQVEVDPNWNWIGFLPQVSQDVATALATLSPTDGDLIKSQYQFAQYDASSSQWVGSLTQLEPGLGYQLYSAATGTIVYSATAASSVVASATTGQQAAKRVVATADLDHGATLEQAHLAEDVDRMTAPSEETRVFDKSAAEPMEADTGDAPQWQPSAFAHTMTLVAALPADLAVTPELRLWAVDGNGAIRGEAVPVFVPEKQAHYAFAMLYSDGAEDETLHLHLATHPDHDAQATATVTFHVGARQGSLAEPVQLLAPQAAIDLPQAYALEANYPNPFNPTTSIRYALPQTSEVRLVVYDVIGREVARLVEGEQKAGWHTISFDGRGLASGMYVYRLEAGDYKQVQRMTLLK
ncbi:MAG: T9SS type A sorting domain-containing protein [Bacteroidota bacterium]